MTSNLTLFTKKYQLSKTLRFELIPQFGTEKIVRTLFEEREKNHTQLINNDLKLSKSYKNVKKLLDCRHREIIDRTLKQFKFSQEELQILNGNNTDDENDDETVSNKKKDPLSKLREKISKALDAKAKVMFESKLINVEKNAEKSGIEEWLDSVEDKYLELGNNERIDKKAIKEDLKNMRKFFTYFGGFNENRKNVYSKEKIPTAIPFRILHINFPIFKKNIENYEKIKKDYPELESLINEKGANEIFTLDYFKQCLTQEGIDFYNQEKLGIVAKEQGREQEKGINQIINEYVQQKNREIKENTSKGEKPKKLKIATFDKLQKQILSISQTKSFQFKVFEDTHEIIEAINERYGYLNNTEDGKQSIYNEIKDFLRSISSYDLEGIYLNEKTINILSKKMFDYGRYIEFALEKWYDDSVNQSGSEKRKFLAKKQYSIRMIQNAINHYLEAYEQNYNLKDKYGNNKNHIIEYFKNPTITIKTADGDKTISEEKELFSELIARKKAIDFILNNDYTKDLKDEKDIDGVKVKNYLDALIEFNYLLNSFSVKDKNIDKDEEFYNEQKRLQELLFEADILALYNQTRNYITQKSYMLDKFKLTFDTPTLLDGWDKNKESSNKAILLTKDNGYYLGVMNKESNTLFEDDTLDIDKIENKLKEEQKKIEQKSNEIKNKKEGTKIYSKLEEDIKKGERIIKELSGNINLLKDLSDTFLKIDYKYFKDCTTMIPKCSIQTIRVKNHFENSESIFEVKAGDSLSDTGEKFSENFKISKEVFDLNNTVYDKTTNAFVPRKKEDNRPKKFQKKYLEQSGDKKGYRSALKTWILFCKSFLESYESTANANYDYNNLFEKSYEDVSAFYNELNTCIYKLSINRKISASYIQQQVQNGKLYLFKIHNKDFNLGSTGTKNLHTLYWEMLFDQRNLDDVVFKLNGGAELFYREASIKKEKVYFHKEGIKVPKKFFELPDGTLEPVPAESIKKLNDYFEGRLPEDKLTETDLRYIDNVSIIKKKNGKPGIIKDERFTEDKIQFHCSITMNFKGDGENVINNRVLDRLHRNDDVHIIGLDRGERHLIYLTMINKQGQIVDGMQFSLNELERRYKVEEKDVVQKIDFNKLLTEKEGNRTEARQNWQTVENIKNLKEGYLSLVIHQLAKLIIDKNAIVVMEDLNYGFKDSRAKVEKQIYQKFENMLIKKLQFFVLDKNNLYEEGGVLKGYQLTNQEVPSYKEMTKQNGFLFYVPADYTSKICPVTGFVNLLNTKYTNRTNAIAFLEKFDKIYYDTKNDYFRFEFDYKKFDKLRVDVSDLNRTQWSVCSHPANRVMAVQVNNQWKKQFVDVNKKLISLFEIEKIDFKSDKCLIKDIIKVERAKFFEDLLYALSALLSLRHTYKDNDKIEHDSIISSVELIVGSNEFYISDKAGSDLPKDADANGAYNIAQKGLWLLNQLDSEPDKIKAIEKFNKLKAAKEIKTGDDTKKKKKVSQWCPNKEWLAYIQSKTQ